MHCNLRPPNATHWHAVPICFNFVAHAKFEVTHPIRCDLIAFLLLACYVTLWPWSLTFDLLTLNNCSISAFGSHGETLYQIWVQWRNPRRSYCDFNIWPYDLEHVSRVALCSGIVCTKFKLSHAIHSWNVMIFFAANISCYAMTLTLNSCARSSVMLSNYLPNLSKIDQSAAELLTI